MVLHPGRRRTIGDNMSFVKFQEDLSPKADVENEIKSFPYIDVVYYIYIYIYIYYLFICFSYSIYIYTLEKR